MVAHLNYTDTRSGFRRGEWQQQPVVVSSTPSVSVSPAIAEIGEHVFLRHSSVDHEFVLADLATTAADGPTVNLQRTFPSNLGPQNPNVEDNLFTPVSTVPLSAILSAQPHMSTMSADEYVAQIATVYRY